MTLIDVGESIAVADDSSCPGNDVNCSRSCWRYDHRSLTLWLRLFQRSAEEYGNIRVR